MVRDILRRHMARKLRLLRTTSDTTLLVHKSRLSLNGRPKPIALNSHMELPGLLRAWLEATPGPMPRFILAPIRAPTLTDAQEVKRHLKVGLTSTKETKTT
jgi:hypothetical protein